MLTSQCRNPIVEMVSKGNLVGHGSTLVGRGIPTATERVASGLAHKGKH